MYDFVDAESAYPFPRFQSRSDPTGTVQDADVNEFSPVGECQDRWKGWSLPHIRIQDQAETFQPQPLPGCRVQGETEENVHVIQFRLEENQKLVSNMSKFIWVWCLL